MCIRTKNCSKTQIWPPLEQNDDSCDGPEVVMQIDLVGKLPHSNGYIHILTACDVVFSTYFFALPLPQPNTIATLRLTKVLRLQLKYWWNVWTDPPLRLITQPTNKLSRQVWLETTTKNTKNWNRSQRSRSLHKNLTGTVTSTVASFPTTGRQSNHWNVHQVKFFT